MKLTIRYLKWRAGRPRWEPGPTLRAKGWKGHDLKDDQGAWLELNAAIEAARLLNAEVEAWRAGGAPRRKPAAPLRPSRTAEHLWEVYRQSPLFSQLAISTRDDYRRKIKIFLAEFGDKHVGAIAKSHLYTWWEGLYEKRGPTMAYSVIAVVRAMFSYAEKKGWRDTNPAIRLGLKTPAPRLVFWLPGEIAAAVAAADRMGHHSVGDVIIAALHSGQRLSDVLAMPDRIFDEQRIRLSQLKMRSRGGALIDAPMTQALKTRVAVIKARKREAGLTRIDTLILREDTSAPYDKYSFNKIFREVRDEAAKETPSLATKTIRDLRDTAVTRLALAQCSLAEIASITGHSPKSIIEILRHYLVLQPEMADAAIAKLSAWLEQNEIAL